jgi:hypothetical protein
MKSNDITTASLKNTSARNAEHTDLLALQDRKMKEIVGAARHFAAVVAATRTRDRRFGRQKALSSFVPEKLS